MDLSDFRDHYQIDAGIFSDLVKEVTAADFIKSIPLFQGTWDHVITSTGLCYYIDDHGDFTENRNSADKIANAVFQSLDARNKIEIMAYLDWYHNGDDDE